MVGRVVSLKNVGLCLISYLILGRRPQSSSSYRKVSGWVRQLGNVCFFMSSGFLIHGVRFSFLTASLRGMSSLMATRAAFCPSFSALNAGRSGMWALKCHRSLQNADSWMPGITGVGSE